MVQAKFCHWEFQVPEKKKKITGRLSKGVFERRTSTLSDAFSFLLSVDTSKFIAKWLDSNRDDLPETQLVTSNQPGDLSQ